MWKCSSGLSKCILYGSNFLIFIIAAAAIGVSLYVFHEEAAKALTKVSLLTVIAIVSAGMMLFSILGCCAVRSPPQKKCSRFCYLLLLLVLLLAETIVAGLILGESKALKVAKDHNFDIKSVTEKKAVDAMHFLHDQLQDFYVREGCSGGSANSTKIPIGFAPITCKSNSDGVNDAIRTIFENNTISTDVELKGYVTCRSDPAYIKQGHKDFTEAFCGSQANIVHLAQKYASYLMWFPVGLAILTLLLLICTICVIAQKNKERQRQIQFSHSNEPLRRVQMAA